MTTYEVVKDGEIVFAGEDRGKAIELYQASVGSASRDVALRKINVLASAALGMVEKKLRGPRNTA